MKGGPATLPNAAELRSGSKETCEIAPLKDGHEPLWAHIEATCLEERRNAAPW